MDRDAGGSKLMKSIGLFLVLFSWIGAAHAYIDPGTGLLLLQGLLAAIGGLIFFVKHPIQALKRFVAKFKKKQS